MTDEQEKRKPTAREELEAAGFRVVTPKGNASRIVFLGAKGTAAVREILRKRKDERPRDDAD